MRGAGENAVGKCESGAPQHSGTSAVDVFPLNEEEVTSIAQGKDEASCAGTFDASNQQTLQSVASSNSAAMTPGQQLLFDSPSEEKGCAVDPPLPDSEAIYGEILRKLRAPLSAVEQVVEKPESGGPMTLITPRGALSRGFMPEWADALTEDYDEVVKRGQKGIGALSLFVAKPVQSIVKASEADLRRVESAVANYEVAAAAVYGEGISYGFSGSKALETYVNRVYELKRAFDVVLPIENRMIAAVIEELGPEALGTDALWDAVEARMEAECGVVEGLAGAYAKIRGMRQLYGDRGLAVIKLSGFNLGLNMTDLNKRDPGGGQIVGNRVRDRVAERFNAIFGRPLRPDGHDGKGMFAADNVGRLKNMTYLAMEVNLSQVQEMGIALQGEMQSFVRSQKEADFKGVPLPMAGYYGTLVIDPAEIPDPRSRTGSVETQVLKFLGLLHAGEDIASKAGPGSGFFLQQGPVDEAKTEAAALELFSMFNASVPLKGEDLATWEPLPPSSLHDGRFEISRDFLFKGGVLRESHAYGLELVHRNNVRKLFGKLTEAIRAFKASGTEEDLNAVIAARKALRVYLRAPTKEIDPERKPPALKLAEDVERARHLFRFSRGGKSGVVAYKLPHLMARAGAKAGRMQAGVEVSVAGGDEFVLVANDGWRKWIIAGELWKFGDFNKAFKDGPGDPSFALLLEAFNVGLRQKMEERSSPMTEADMHEALAFVSGEVERIFRARAFVYSDKVALPGGKWKGLQYGVKDGGLVFKRPKSASAKVFAQQVKAVMADAGFRAVLAQAFGVSGDAFAILPAAQFDKEGAIVRRQHWELVAADGSKHTLYLDPGMTVTGASRPTTTLRAEFAAAALDDPRDAVTLVKEVLPKGVALGKEQGGGVAVLKGLTFAQKAGGRSGHRLILSAGSFAFADIGSKAIVGLLTYASSGDVRDLAEGIGFDTAKAFAGMTAGGLAGDAAWRGAVGFSSGRLFVHTGAGWTFNPAALKKPIVGRKATAGKFVSTSAAVATMDLMETGSVDPLSLANTLAVMKGAQWITHGIAALGPLKSLKAGHPLALLLEFLAMQGISALEARAILAHETHVRRARVAAAMRDIDLAIEGIKRSDAGGTGCDADLVAKELDAACSELEESSQRYAEILKYTDAEEYEKSVNAWRDAEEDRVELEAVQAMTPRPDVPLWLLGLAYAGPTTAGAKFVPAHTQEELKAMAEARRRKVEDGERTFAEEVEHSNETFVASTANRGGQVAAKALHVPFPSEEPAFVAAWQPKDAGASLVSGAGYMHRKYSGFEGWVPSGKEAGRAFAARYVDGISKDPYLFTLQHLLFVSERETYLRSFVGR